jgi:hypothetical protein
MCLSNLYVFVAIIELMKMIVVKLVGVWASGLAVTWARDMARLPLDHSSPFIIPFLFFWLCVRFLPLLD